MFCDGCGQSNRDEARFCRSCGVPLGTERVSSEDETTAVDLRPTPGPAPSPIPDSVVRALRGAFTIDRLLGKGGMGSVYLAQETALDRPVAVKVLPPAMAEDSKTVERFQREARLAARLRHPHIVSIHSVGDRDGIFYFTMDYIDGETLDAWVRRRSADGPIDRRKIRSVFSKIVAAVAHAHSNDIIHRDLKPANIMLDRSEHLFVMDFGLAKVRTGGGGLTTSGMIVGTPQYMSPEQIQGAEVDARSDIYALGLIYFFLFTGESLVRGENISSVVAQHLTTNFGPAVASHGSIPAEDRNLILRMIEKEAGRRPASLAPILESLATIDSGIDPGATSPHGSAPSAAPPLAQASTPEPAPARPAVDRKGARDRMRGLLGRIEKKDEK